MSACDSVAISETISDTVEDDEALESVDDDDTVDVIEALDDELDDSSAASRLVRSVSSDDSKLLALDELSVELDELELPETPDGGGPGGGPPAPPGPPGPPVEAPLAELWLLSDDRLLSCDRKASTAADKPTAVDASEDDTVALADAEVDVLALELSEELL